MAITAGRLDAGKAGHAKAVLNVWRSLGFSGLMSARLDTDRPCQAAAHGACDLRPGPIKRPAVDSVKLEGQHL